MSNRTKDLAIAEYLGEYERRRHWAAGSTRRSTMHYEHVREDGNDYVIEGEWPKYGKDPRAFVRLLKRINDEAIVVTGWHDIGGAHRYEVDGVGAFADCPMVALRDAVHLWLQYRESST